MLKDLNKIYNKLPLLNPKNLKMKKNILILTIAFLSCCAFNSNAQTPTCSIANFTSTCVKTTAPRQFTISFKITVSGGTATSVLLSTTNGNFNAMPNGYTVPITNNVATISFTYSEIMPQATLPINMTFSNTGNVVFKNNSTQTLCICGVNCSVNWIKLDTTGTIAHYGAPGVHLLNASAISVVAPKGLLAGPDKVKSIVTTISNTQRKLNCTNPPGTWTSVSLPMQPLGSTNSTNTATTATQYFTTNGIDISQKNDYAFTVALPTNKLVPNATCPEEYRMKITIVVNFVNGCSKTISFWKTSVRP
jgi:hypothetical protein